jgi:DNA-binding transcriptional regulator GbsR (MarR family)
MYFMAQEDAKTKLIEHFSNHPLSLEVCNLAFTKKKSFTANEIAISLRRSLGSVVQTLRALESLDVFSSEKKRTEVYTARERRYTLKSPSLLSDVLNSDEVKGIISKKSRLRERRAPLLQLLLQVEEQLTEYRNAIAHRMKVTSVEEIVVRTDLGLQVSLNFVIFDSDKHKTGVKIWRISSEEQLFAAVGELASIPHVLENKMFRAIVAVLLLHPNLAQQSPTIYRLNEIMAPLYDKVALYVVNEYASDSDLLEEHYAKSLEEQIFGKIIAK